MKFIVSSHGISIDYFSMLLLGKAACTVNVTSDKNPIFYSYFKLQSQTTFTLKYPEFSLYVDLKQFDIDHVSPTLR